MRSLEHALGLFRQLARPVGIVAGVTTEEFAGVYQGDGGNEPETPLAAIFPKATKLALFAATIGDEVGEEISRLFGLHEFDLGYLLDAVASSGTERLADLVQDAYCREVGIQESAVLNSAICNLHSELVLRYSPGYCGWDISGQKRLFQALRPEEIGITLRPSCLMEPLKSVSGVLVGGRPEIHEFDDSYPFCHACATHSCRERMSGITGIQT